MGEAGLRRARAHFTWEQVSEKLIDVYESVVGVERSRLVQESSARFHHEDIKVAA